MKIKSIVLVFSAVLWTNIASAWSHSPSSMTVSAKGGSFTIKISGTEYYDFVAGSGKADWITVSRLDNRTFQVTVAANDSKEPRKENIVITAYRADAGAHNQFSWVGSQYCWVSQEGRIVWSDLTYKNLMGATHDNPLAYREGASFSFKEPSTVAGYTFVGWRPSCITSTTTGDKVITATWRPNAPTILPSDRTIIESSVTVNIASDNPAATIYCTTDGTEPTTSSPIYKRFKASSKMVVKAIAVVEGMTWSETTMAEYALGQCENPTIMPTDGTVFGNSNYQVEIAKNGEKGVLRYTTDGSDPTADSPIYSGPFPISETTTVKAKTFDTEYFDSAVVSATLTRQWAKVSTPVINAPASFSGSKQSVSLTCATEDAVIRYTTDGSDPNSHSKKYTGAFDVTATTVVRAIAFKADFKESDVATLTISKQWCIGDSLNDPDRQFMTDVNAGWTRDTTVSHDGSESMRSGAVADSATTGVFATSTLSTVVEGKGIVQFWWKASCEEDDVFEWDHGEFRVDGVVVKRINGETTGWNRVSHEIRGEGPHTLAWVYCKDDFGKEGNDGIWLDEVIWDSHRAILSELTIEVANEIVVSKDATCRCTAIYDDGTTMAVSPQWDIVSGAAQVSIDASGRVTALREGTATIRATFTENGVTQTATKTIIIQKGLSSVQIEGAAILYSGDSHNYACRAIYSDGSTEFVSGAWGLNSGLAAATLTTDGVLTAKDTDGQVVLYVSYDYAGDVKTATKTVAVRASYTVPAAVTGGNPHVVPARWRRRYKQFDAKFGTDPVAAMAKLTGKKDGTGRALTVWDDYVVGTDPTDLTDAFKVEIEMIGGKPLIRWEPNLNQQGEARIYRVWGAESLANPMNWERPANSSVHRFFKVDVALPEDGEGETDSPGTIMSVISVQPPMD